MIPFELTAGLDELRQPRLLRPVCPNMLGSDELPSGDLLAGVDALFAEHAVQRLMAWEMPPGLRVPRSPAERWRTVSALQKAIRFGDVATAMNAAHALHEIDARYLWRRLVVCALEDVFLGNLLAVAATLALVGDRPSRKLVGDQKAAVGIAATLAAGWKDRTACNLCTLADFDRALFPARNEWKSLPDETLAIMAADMDRPVQERMLAAWLLAGTKRFFNFNVPKDNDRPRWSLMRLMVAQEMPLFLYWLADRAATRGGDCLFVSVLAAWQMMQAGEIATIELRSNEIPEGLMLDGLPAAAYDMHTREGQAALRRFAEVPAIAEALAPIASTDDRRSALFAAVFVVEGGKLALRVSTPEIDRHHFAAIRLELGYFGLSSLSDQSALLRAIREHLSLLHGYRKSASRLHPGEVESRSHPVPQGGGLTTLPGQQGLQLQHAYTQPISAPLPILPDHDLERGRRVCLGVRASEGP